MGVTIGVPVFDNPTARANCPPTNGDWTESLYECTGNLTITGDVTLKANVTIEITSGNFDLGTYKIETDPNSASLSAYSLSIKLLTEDKWIDCSEGSVVLQGRDAATAGAAGGHGGTIRLEAKGGVYLGAMATYGGNGSAGSNGTSGSPNGTNGGAGGNGGAIYVSNSEPGSHDIREIRIAGGISTNGGNGGPGGGGYSPSSNTDNGGNSGNGAQAGNAGEIRITAERIAMANVQLIYTKGGDGGNSNLAGSAGDKSCGAAGNCNPATCSTAGPTGGNGGSGGRGGVGALVRIGASRDATTTIRLVIATTGGKGGGGRAGRKGRNRNMLQPVWKRVSWIKRVWRPRRGRWQWG